MNENKSKKFVYVLGIVTLVLSTVAGTFALFIAQASVGETNAL